MHFEICVTKKSERKPYLARLTGGGNREWAKRLKGSNTTVRFFFPDLSAGNAVEFRGEKWNGDAYVGGTYWAVVTQTNCALVARSLAMRLAESEAAGNPAIEIVGSDFAGDLSAGLTAEEEARLREANGGDFLAVRMKDGSLLDPHEICTEQERFDGTIRGFAWQLPIVLFCDCEAAKAADVAE